MSDPKDTWKTKLPDDVYNICWNKGTEPPFSGKYNKHTMQGTYHCTCCKHPLFPSDTKFDSGSGWPSFWDPKDTNFVCTETDTSHGMTRTEVLCAKCGAHLGHVFEDGPPPTGKRYCINSLALQFQALKDDNND